MNNKVYFMNNGAFDLRGMLTMGLSAKHDEGAIGFFGTGFKYAVAIILRNLGTIKITTKGGDGRYYIYDFFVKREEFRGKEVDFVFIHDHVTGDSIPCNFTNRMGINWEPWMAFRELYCNCSDEHGTVSADYQDGFDTVIEVECSRIAQAFASKDNYILPKMEPIHTGKECDIYEAKLPYIYYRGIAVMRLDESAFSYNIKSHIDLTEDRTVKYEHQVRWVMQKELQHTQNESIIQAVVQEKCYENSQGFDKDWGVGEKFVEACERLEKSDKGISPSARGLIKHKKFKERNFPEFTLSEVQEKQALRAKAFLMAMDLPVDEYPIKYVTGLGDGVMGQALDGTIYISEMPFNMGTKQLASTLMEEWVHLKTGCADFDRRMQNWLFDKILTLGENINGEPI
jgi:hypothetical protein